MRSRILETREDRYNERARDIAQEFDQECCDGATASAEFTVTRYWRGWSVTCDKCGALLAELDD